MNDNNIQYIKYVYYKDLFNFSINGYSAINLLRRDIINYSYGEINFDDITLKSAIISSLHTINLAPLVDLLKTNDIIISTLYDRKDHELFVDKIIPKIAKTVKYINRNHQIILFYKVINIATSLYKIIKIKGLTFKEKLFFFKQLSVYLNSLSFLDANTSSIDFRTKKFVAFNGPDANDALLTAYFKKKGSTTFSLQHGLFCEYKNFIPLDIINYEFSLTDFILCWGKQAKYILKKWGVDEKKLLLAGNPKYSNENLSEPKVTFNSCLVLLGRYIYHEGNMKLLDILYKASLEFKFKVALKPHPSLLLTPEYIDYNNYIEKAKEYNFDLLDQKNILVDDLLLSRKYDFSISYNTSAYIESYLRGLICLRYSFEENDIIPGLYDRFQDFDELKNLIFNLKHININELSNQVRVLLVDSLGLGIDNYKNILENNICKVS